MLRRMHAFICLRKNPYKPAYLVAWTSEYQAHAVRSVPDPPCRVRKPNKKPFVFILFNIIYLFYIGVLLFDFYLVVFPDPGFFWHAG